MSEITNLFDDLNKSFIEFKDCNNKRFEKLEKGQGAAYDAEVVDRLQDRIDQLEKGMTKFSRPAGGGNVPRDEYHKQYLTWVRKGVEGPDLQKAMTEGTTTEGGFTVPAIVADQIAEKIAEFSPVRQVAQVVTTSQGASLDYPREDGAFTAAWATETGARAASTAGTFTNVNIPAIEMFVNPEATPALLSDSAFNIEAYISRKVGEQFGALEGTGFVAGTGTAEPLGIIDASSGISTFDISATGAPVAVTADGVIALFYSVKSGYVQQASWLMNRTTIRDVRTLRDDSGGAGTGQYLWQPGLQAGQPPTILGRPVFESPDFEDPGTNDNRVMAFGDWQRAYVIHDKADIVQLRDPYSNKPFVSFYTVRRTGGAPVTVEAAIIGTVTTT